MTVALLTLASLLSASAVEATAAEPTTRIGGHSRDWAWFDAAIGPVQIYRNFDTGFSYATWQDTAAYRAHPAAPANDYSVSILPQRLLDPADPINQRLRDFIATTPKNIILTNYHEPDFKYSGRFTPAQFRAGILALARMVRAQNSKDGGTRRTSVILMDVTFNGYWDYPASAWWPTDARDGGHVDLISGDIYARPHATGTACCPAGYTDGVNWLKAPYLLSFLYNFAVDNNTPWAVSELGYLEDVNDPSHRANTLADVVAFAKARGALHVSYFDTWGTRADWRLRYSTPVGTTSATSKAAQMWKSLVNTP